MNIVLTGGKVTTLCSVFTRVTLSLYLKQLWLPLELFVSCLRLLFLLCSSACLSVYLSLSLCLSLWMCVSVMWVWRSSHSDGYLIAVEPPHLLQASHLQPINSSTLQNINPGLSATHCLAVVQVGLLGHRLFKLWFQVTPCVFIHLLLCFFLCHSITACLPGCALPSLQFSHPVSQILVSQNSPLLSHASSATGLPLPSSAKYSPHPPSFPELSQ